MQCVSGVVNQIKHVDSSVSYQQAIHRKYDQRRHELPSGYGP